MAPTKLEQKIIVLLKKSATPISTREIALQAGKSWHTVLTACLRLQIQGKIRGFKAGNTHLWQRK